MSKNNLVYILNNYSSKSCEHFYHVVHLLETMADMGTQIHLIIEKGDSLPTISNKNIEITLLGRGNRYIELFKVIRGDIKKGYTRAYIRISQYSTLTVILASLFSKMKVLYWHSGTVFEYDDEQPFNLKKIKWFFKSRLPFNVIKYTTDYFVSGPEWMLEYYRDVVHVPKHKLKLLYNDIDPSRFSRGDKQEIREELKIDKSCFVFVFVHRFSPVRKSAMYIPQIFDEFFAVINDDKVRFYLIGGGPDKEELEALIKTKAYSNQVLFLGGIPNSDIQKYYQAADVYINPTHAEGFPRTIIEAMGCGLPIVTTNAGGIRDILPPSQHKYMSDIDDVAQFSKNLVDIYNEKDGLEVYINDNTTRIQRYSTDNVAKMYINLLENI